jgi:uncharacterized membrane protein YdjX (TVP38/TMEM64 family)
MSNRPTTAPRQIGWKLALRGAFLVATLIASGYLINRYRFEDVLWLFDFSQGDDTDWLNGRIAYFALAVLFTAAGGPRQAVAFFSAYFFGLGAGFAIALAGTLAGCALTLTMAIVFGGAARKLLRGKVAIALQIWAAHPFGMTLVLRLLPIGSNLVTNLAAGVARIPVAGFIAGTLVGYVPQTLVFSLMGSGVNIGSEARIALSILLFALSVVAGAWIYARYRKSIRAETKPPVAAGPVAQSAIPRESGESSYAAAARLRQADRKVRSRRG